MIGRRQKLQAMRRAGMAPVVLGRALMITSAAVRPARLVGR